MSSNAYIQGSKTFTVSLGIFPAVVAYCVLKKPWKKSQTTLGLQ
jgi:hypothetical protein